MITNNGRQKNWDEIFSQTNNAGLRCKGLLGAFLTYPKTEENDYSERVDYRNW